MATAPKVQLFGMPVAAVTAEEVLNDLEGCIVERQCGQYVVTLNVDILLTALENPDLFEACQAARWVVADGMPLVYASRLLGRPLPERVNGADLALGLVERAAARGYRVFLLGGESGVPEAAARRLRERLSGLQVVGTLSPPFGFDSRREEVDRTVAAVRAAAADIVLVGLGAPKQELWLRHHLARAGAPVGVGVGGTFNFWAGRVRRAPVAFQQAGLEWLWRLAQEPRRLWRRYLIRDLKFFPLLARELWRRWSGKNPTVSQCSC
jgi:N-acetylglucosaminyldiphosphoundecaprenol N-acetyl-beta-D-mannosaminyltransferase